MKEKKTTSINLRGIERAISDTNVPDGAGEEIINLRLKDGAWRPLGGKVLVNTFTPITGYEDFTNIYKHSILPENLYIAKYNNDIIIVDAGDSIRPLTYNPISDEITTFDIQIYIKGSYTIESDVAWMTPAEEEGSGYGSVTITVGPSITTERTGKITVTGPNGAYDCDVTQGGINIVATSPALGERLAGDVVIDITEILPVGATFTSVELVDESWITNLVDDQGADTVTATLTENITGSDRSATIRITLDDYPSVYVDVTLTQTNTLAIVATPDSFSWLWSVTTPKVSSIFIDPDDTIVLDIDDERDAFNVIIDQGLNTVTIKPVGTNPGSIDNNMTIIVDGLTNTYVPDIITCVQLSED
jgi:hypothetical protein